ncbi:LysM peptidoglycan-binding domain-containing protein [Scatolibacter rhodanostii]|uniref:LysM peptidoglycan-binding domain-containing protein n=1 Tax=Scatolibacter rhodanostii TaxID=2014781 RepID=UPI000C08B3CE|nr:LysM peptidoglycan-binding domain-containing protein [Scatolibacter rhodanostii]
MSQTFGVDISYANGDVDFHALKAAGVKFVILRCGYGNDMAHQDDAQYFANLEKCKIHNMPYGVYLYSYARNVEMAKSEAAHTLRLLKNTNPQYGVWYDLEDKILPSGEVLIDMAVTYCDIIKEAGYYAGIYANLYWFNVKLNDSRLNQYGRWVAQWSNANTYEKTFDIWQFTDSYQIGGKGFDGNYAYKDFLSGTPETPGKPTSPPIKEPAPSATDTYVVQSGDTLGGIAEKHGTTYQKLAEINGISNPNLIYTGQVIKLTASTSPAVPTTPSASENYVVQSGDTLGGIAAKYGTTYQKLAEINGLANPNLIYPGQVIKISGTASAAPNNYTVQSGDTLSGIASKYNTTYQKLAEINGISNPNLIYVGQVIRLS